MSTEVPTKLPNHYTILALPSPSTLKAPAPSEKDIKNAYRRAILLNHPDKASIPAADTAGRQSQQKSQSLYSIDAITVAYRTLISPALRIEYDRSLALTAPSPTSTGAFAQPHNPGLETIDLDEMHYVSSDEPEADGSGLWWKGCRCGKEMAFVIPERELEEYAEEGEVVIECGGCSLWVRIVFGVLELEGSQQDEAKEAG